VQANFLKTVGYLISTVSVVLLGWVAWSTVQDNPALRIAMFIGVGASIAGMLLRWLSYQVREREEEGSATASARRREAHFR
jgi:membrane protein DedA with SNARE-associated domain